MPTTDKNANENIELDVEANRYETISARIEVESEKEKDEAIAAQLQSKLEPGTETETGTRPQLLNSDLESLDLNQSDRRPQGNRPRSSLHSQEYHDRAPIYHRERILSSKDRFRRMSQPDPPVDPKTFFDFIISCGLGARSYTLGPSFHNPNFRVRFASKIYAVLLVQLLFVIVWMSLVLTSQSFTEMQTERTGIIIVSSTIYLLLNTALRWLRCGGDGMCFMGYMVITIFLTTSLSIASGGLVVIYPVFIFIVSGIWLTIALLLIGNFSRQINILTNLVYGWTLVSAGLSSVCMIWLLHQLQPELTIPPRGDLIHGAILPIALSVEISALFIVYEVKKLIGGRRGDFNENQWILAAIIL